MPIPCPLSRSVGTKPGVARSASEQCCPEIPGRSQGLDTDDWISSRLGGCAFLILESLPLGRSAIEEKLKVLILTHFGITCAVRGAPARDPGSSACQNSSERRGPFVDATSGVTAVAPEGGTFKDG